MSTNTLLSEVEQKLGLCRSKEEILEVVLRYVGQVLNNSNIAVHMSDTVGTSFRPMKMNQSSQYSEEDWKNNHNRIKLNYEKDLLFQEVVKTKKAIFIPDVELDHRPNHEACRLFGIRGLLMIPLSTEDVVLGTIAVASLEKTQIFSEDVIDNAQRITYLATTYLMETMRRDRV